MYMGREEAEVAYKPITHRPSPHFLKLSPPLVFFSSVLVHSFTGSFTFLTILTKAPKKRKLLCCASITPIPPPSPPLVLLFSV